MDNRLHITSGDIAGRRLAKAGLPGEVFVWHDILYDGPRNPGWPDEATLRARADFIEKTTAGGLGRQRVLETFRNQYRKLAATVPGQPVVLWFDACLFDQSMLAHVLTCLQCKGIREVELLCVDAFPGIEPFHGLGQLHPGQFASLYDRRRPVTDAQFSFAVVAADTPPQFWGDTTLWARINGLADRVPPLVQIEGPADRLPQWERDVSLADFTLKLHNPDNER